MKRAFVVMGVPSSGTRLMTRILIAAGCKGDGTHEQIWDERQPDADLVVVRRHQPTGRPPKWASNPNIILALRDLGYAVTGIIISRDWHSTVDSMIAAPHAADAADALTLCQGAWRSIFRGLPEDCPFEIVSYESLVQRPVPVIAKFCERHDLSVVSSLEPIKDGNTKYYGA